MQNIFSETIAVPGRGGSAGAVELEPDKSTDVALAIEELVLATCSALGWLA